MDSNRIFKDWLPWNFLIEKNILWYYCVTIWQSVSLYICLHTLVRWHVTKVCCDSYSLLSSDMFPCFINGKGILIVRSVSILKIATMFCLAVLRILTSLRAYGRKYANFVARMHMSKGYSEVILSVVYKDVILWEMFSIYTV